MAGLDLPVKLRRGLGKGKVVPAEELERSLSNYDGDGDGAMTQAELVTFFEKHRVGGPWFCQVLAKTLWRIAEERWAREIDSISIEALARIIHYSMSQPPKPDKRYVITPDVMHGLAPPRSVQDMKAAEASKAAEAQGQKPGPVPRERPNPRPGAGRKRPRAAPRRPGAKPRR